jgi:hypothetical protein
MMILAIPIENPGKFAKEVPGADSLLLKYVSIEPATEKVEAGSSSCAYVDTDNKATIAIKILFYNMCQSNLQLRKLELALLLVHMLIVIVEQHM